MDLDLDLQNFHTNRQKKSERTKIIMMLMNLVCRTCQRLKESAGNFMETAPLAFGVKEGVSEEHRIDGKCIH